MRKLLTWWKEYQKGLPSEYNINETIEESKETKDICGLEKWNSLLYSTLKVAWLFIHHDLDLVDFPHENDYILYAI